MSFCNLVATMEKKDGKLVVGRNRRAGFDYAIEETFEAGIELFGTEVKSLRNGRVDLSSAYVSITREMEAMMQNCNIPVYEQASAFSKVHDPKRNRKLLLHKRQIIKLYDQVKTKGKTLVVIEVYANKRNIFKVLVGLAKGKTEVDKRHNIKERDLKRQSRREMAE